MMESVYLLINDQENVCWSLEQDVMQTALSHSKYYCVNEVIQINIDEKLCKELLRFSRSEIPINLFAKPELVPYKYVYEIKSHLDAHPKNCTPEYLRAFVIFDSKGRCFWSPSGHNLNLRRQQFPDKYLCDAICVPLTIPQYIKLFSFYEWVVDNY
jgi:hypothetical protein